MNKKKILDYWNLRAGKKILKCTNDINLESNEIKIFLSIIKKKKNVLDIGCGEGELLRNLKKKNKCNCYGIDFSQKLIKIAKQKSKNINYYCMDMNKIKDEFKAKIKFDYIITKRSIQNLTSWTEQKKFINQLKFFSGPKTKILLMESSNDGLININQMRKKLKLKKIIRPWHNLYLEDKKLKEPITPEEVVACMVGVKTARLAEDINKDDSWIDIIGYAALGGEIINDK